MGGQSGKSAWGGVTTHGFIQGWGWCWLSSGPLYWPVAQQNSHPQGPDSRVRAGSVLLVLREDVQFSLK